VTFKFFKKKSVFEEDGTGTHYQQFPIQPSMYSYKNKLGVFESNIIKYATRHKVKGGKKDIIKLIHYAKMILELEYGTDKP